MYKKFLFPTICWCLERVLGGGALQWGLSDQLKCQCYVHAVCTPPAVTVHCTDTVHTSPHPTWGQEDAPCLSLLHKIYNQIIRLSPASLQCPSTFLLNIHQRDNLRSTVDSQPGINLCVVTSYRHPNWQRITTNKSVLYFNFFLNYLHKITFLCF